ncbi:MAG: GAF domain-containing protein [Nostoc sp.]
MGKIAANVKNYLTPEILQSAIHHTVELILLTRKLEQSRQQQQMMAAIALRIRQSLELEEILSVTAAEVRQFLQTDRVVIYKRVPISKHRQKSENEKVQNRHCNNSI